jgi:hypothetical protein
MLQLERVDPDNFPVTLSPEHIRYSYGVLEDLCSAFRLSQLRNALTEMLQTCLTVEDDIFQKAEKRAEILYICKSIEKAIEAVYLILSQRKPQMEE